MTSQEFKQKCIELRKKNLRIQEISQILNRSKTSVYFHIKDIAKSEILIRRIKEENRLFLNTIRPNLKGISWTGRHCRGFQEWTPEVVNLIAHTIFDGEFNRTNTFYHNRSIRLISNFKESMKIIYDFEPAVYKDKNGVIRLGYYSVELTNFLREKSSYLVRNISLMSIDFQRAFLKAFFDDEGSIYFQKKRNSRRVKGCQHKDEILFLVHSLLKNFEIESKVDARFHEIIISRKENLEKFAKEVNFSPGVKVNGLRSNSIWKQDLEKREILKMALDSYLPTYSEYYSRYK